MTKIEQVNVKTCLLKLLNFYMNVEEPWKGSVLEVHHTRTTDGSDLGVMDPNYCRNLSPLQP